MPEWKRRHHFDLSHPSLNVSALGNHVVWAISLKHICDRDNLHGFVTPMPTMDPAAAEVWAEIFKPSELVSAGFSQYDSHTAPDEAWKGRGLEAPTIWENAVWESGFLLAVDEKIQLPVLWKSNPQSKVVLIAPIEITDGNRFYDSAFWLETIREIKRLGHAVGIIGLTDRKMRITESGSQLFRDIEAVADDHDLFFPATLDGLKQGIAASGWFIGASVGPSWACLLSDIKQIALDRPRDAFRQWSFARSLPVISKAVHIIEGKRPFLHLIERNDVPSTSLARKPSFGVDFPHGLGDASNFARIVSTYVRRGVEVTVGCDETKEFVFNAVGAKTQPLGRLPHHDWSEDGPDTIWNWGQDVRKDWAGNKT